MKYGQCRCRHCHRPFLTHDRQKIANKKILCSYCQKNQDRKKGGTA